MRKTSDGQRCTATYPSIDLVLLDFALRLDHEQRVVKQEHHEVSAVTLCVTALLECAFIDELTTVLLESEVLHETVSLILSSSHATRTTHNMLSLTKYKLLV